MKLQSGSSSNLCFTTALDNDGWPMPRRGRLSQGKAIVQEAVWDPGQVWTGAENLDPRTVQPVANGILTTLSPSMHGDYSKLTTCSRLLPEKLKCPQLSKIFSACYGTRRCITAFTSACQLSVSWARWIQSMPANPTSWRSILILSSLLRLGLQSGLLPSGFPTKIPCASLLSPIRATCSTPLMLLDSITRRRLLQCW